MKLLALLTLGISFLFALVDINTADIKELRTLKGIGKSKAQKIVDFRKKYCFKNAKELILIKGIGIKTVENNVANIEVSECK